MSIIKQNSLLAFLLTFIVVVSCVTDVKAGTLSQNPLLSEPDADNLPNPFHWMNVPVVCGTTDTVNMYVIENNFKLESFSFGRVNGKEDGEIAFLVSYFINEEQTETMAVITSPSGHESCIMYRSYNLKLVMPGVAL